MYAIDFATTTPQDIIKRSIVCHPSLFAERMDAIACIHAQARAVIPQQRDKNTAERLRLACNYVADIIRSADAADEMAAKIVLLGMDYWISALNVAAKLQCIPFATISDIVSRYEAQRNAE